MGNAFGIGALAVQTTILEPYLIEQVSLQSIIVRTAGNSMFILAVPIEST